MKIRTKIALYFAPFILVAVGAILTLNYYIIRNKLAADAHEEMAKAERNMHRAADSLLNAAVTNYLRGITEKNLSFIEAQYYAVLAGTQSKKDARENVRRYFDHQAVGSSGYLAAVERRDSKLLLEVHPYLRHEDCTEMEGCINWARTRNGYTEYDWKNPHDTSMRKKAAYVREFLPWGWIIGASSYRDEFVQLVNIDDLGNLIKPIRINKTGYFTVIDEKRQVLIHPELEKLPKGRLVNSEGVDVIDLLTSSEDKYITYTWRNPSEQRDRLKYAFVSRLEKFNWYLVATGYVDEIYEPIAYLRGLTIGLMLLASVALLAIIIRVSGNISKPLSLLELGVDQFFIKRKPFFWKGTGIEEIDILGNGFADMTGELTRSLRDLEDKNLALVVSEREKDESRNLLNSIINSMPSLIIGLDAELLVTEWNQWAEKVSGYSRQEARGESLYTVCPWLEPYRSELEKCFLEHEVKTLPMSGTDDHGKIRYTEITVYPLLAASRSGAVLRIDEVTGRVEMEQRLRQSQKMDAVGQLAGGVAHDFNNMLAGIVGAAEMLRIKAGSEEQQLVKIIAEAAGRAGELIRKLLAFSRKGNVDFAPVNMHEVITSTIDILRRSLDKRIAISEDFRAGTAMVMGEWSQLQNTLLNIGINGGHAMADGGELVFATSNEILDAVYCELSSFDLRPGPYLRVDISDTGCGIPQKNLKRIFEPFFTTREKDKGTGLGLAAVYGEMQRHRGAVTVVSEEGRGTTFSLFLLVSDTEITEEPAREREPVMGSGCILIVDDEALVRTTARMMMEKLGYSVLEAEDGLAGLAVYEQHRPTIDMVLLDMQMPVMDGNECFYRLKSLDPEVRVVIASGFTRDADLGMMRGAGLADFVRKPFNLQELSEVLARVLT